MINVTTRIRKKRLNKHGESLVYGVIFEGRDNKEFSLGVKVKPKYWDGAPNYIKSGEDNYLQKRSIIRRELDKISKIIEKGYLSEDAPTVVGIYQTYKAGNKTKNSPLLVQYLKSYINDNPDNLGEGTLIYYNTCLRRIKKFKSDITLEEVDEKFLRAFEGYMKEEFSNTNNTIFNRLKVIRKIMYVAKKEGLVNHNPFEYYKIKTDKTKREFLTWKELQGLLELNNLTHTEELVRDVYAFSALAGGLRFGDICFLETQDNIKGDRLQLKTRKTDETVSFKLNKYALEIVEKYKSDSKYLFPIIDPESKFSKLVLISRRNAYFNKVIKKLAGLAEIDKKLTMHTARHTFATISLNLGVQTEVVGEIMGHQDLKTTQIYTNILDERKDQAIDKWDQL